MKNHQSACFFLLILTIGMLYGVNALRNSTSHARDLASQGQIEAESSEQQAQLAQIQLKSLDAKTSELRSIYEQWKPHFESFRTPQSAEHRIVEVIREGSVFLLSQKFDTRIFEKGSIIPEALVADLVIEDDYTKTLNWLGRLEEAIPNCRVTKCHIEQGGRPNDIHLTVQVEVPILKS